MIILRFQGYRCESVITVFTWRVTLTVPYSWEWIKNNSKFKFQILFSLLVVLKGLFSLCDSISPTSFCEFRFNVKRHLEFKGLFYTQDMLWNKKGSSAENVLNLTVYKFVHWASWLRHLNSSNKKITWKFLKIFFWKEYLSSISSNRKDSWLSNLVTSRLDNLVISKLDNLVTSKLDNLVTSRLDNLVTSRLDNLVTSKMDNLVTSRLDNLVTSKLDNLVTSRLDNLVTSRLDNLVTSRLQSYLFLIIILHSYWVEQKHFNFLKFLRNRIN